MAGGIHGMFARGFNTDATEGLFARGFGVAASGGGGGGGGGSLTVLVRGAFTSANAVNDPLVTAGTSNVVRSYGDG